MKYTYLTILSLFIGTSISAQIYIGKTSEITFFSESTVENISAVNTNTKPILNTKTGALQTRVNIKSFKFEKPLMEEHFNETYLESETYPYAYLRGKIKEQIDYSKDGEYKVSVTGTIEIHGVKQERTYEGTLIVKGEEIQISADFIVTLADYKVKIPSLQKLAISETIEVKVNATLVPYKKSPK